MPAQYTQQRGIIATVQCRYASLQRLTNDSAREQFISGIWKQGTRMASKTPHWHIVRSKLPTYLITRWSDASRSWSCYKKMWVLENFGSAGDIFVCLYVEVVFLLRALNIAPSFINLGLYLCKYICNFRHIFKSYFFSLNVLYVILWKKNSDRKFGLRILWFRKFAKRKSPKVSLCVLSYGRLFVWKISTDNFTTNNLTARYNKGVYGIFQSIAILSFKFNRERRFYHSNTCWKFVCTGWSKKVGKT